MKKRNLLLMLILIAVLALVVVGCGQKAEEPAGDQSAAEQPTEQSQAEQPAGQEQTAEGQEQTEQESAENQNQEFAFVASSEHPDGCASCHQQNGDKDYRLSAEVKNVEGHPSVADDAGVNTCIACHKDGSIGPAFKEKLHEVHLLGDENHFVTNYGGACNQCHKMAESGEMVVKGLEAAGTKFVEIKTANVDLAENGCTSCHQKNGEKDYRLSAEVKNIEGHPSVGEDAGLETCIACHKDGSIGPAFKEAIHSVHFSGGDENHFTNYGSSCRNCHSIAENGAISVKGL